MTQHAKCVEFKYNFVKQFLNITEKYDYVGKLLRPGEQAADYEVEEEENSASSERAAGEAKKTE